MLWNSNITIWLGIISNCRDISHCDLLRQYGVKHLGQHLCATRLCGTKAIPEQMLNHCQLDSSEKRIREIWIKKQPSRKLISKCPLSYGGHFCRHQYVKYTAKYHIGQSHCDKICEISKLLYFTLDKPFRPRYFDVHCTIKEIRKSELWRFSWR